MPVDAGGVDARQSADGEAKADGPASSPDAGGAEAPAGGQGTLQAGAVFACPPGQTYGDPLPANRTATLIKGGYKLIEGPVWVAAQKALYFSEFTDSGATGRIHKYFPADNHFEVFVENVGVNGMALDAQGMLVAASQDKQRLTRFNPATGARTDVPGASSYMGKPFNCVNDVVIRWDGNMYFTDPNYQQGGRPGQDDMGYYRLSPEGMVTRIGTAVQPNGITISADGKYLFVGNTDPVGATSVKRFGLAADGSVVGPPTVFQMPGSDGMTVDCAGNLYISSYKANLMRVVSPDGKVLGEITGFGNRVFNSAFGGDDGKTLFITSLTGLFQIHVEVPGMTN